METKMIKVPFEVELAKKITNGEIDGRIITRSKAHVRLVCWDFKMSNKSNHILGIINRGKDETSRVFNFNGRVNNELESRDDLILEILEYMTFKDGDVATLGWHGEDGEYCEWITILKSVEADEINILTEDYVTVCLKCDAENYFPIDFDCTSDGAKWIRKPTEPEKQRLIEALKSSKEQKAKEYLKRFFGIEVKQEYEFKPFDKVLVRDGNDGCWHADIFSHKNKDRGRYYCTGYEWRQCIPYNEQTAHLLGTTDNYQ